MMNGLVDRMHKDGLNNLLYELVSIEMKKLYTHVFVRINKPKVREQVFGITPKVYMTNDLGPIHLAQGNNNDQVNDQYRRISPGARTWSKRMSVMTIQSIFNKRNRGKSVRTKHRRKYMNPNIIHSEINPK